MLYLYNTLTRKKELFKSVQDKLVKLYTCGPTVYSYAHIGNLRTYIFEDILKRVLLFEGYKVKHVMNITDVGHLTSNADTGEDKIEKAAQQEKRSAWEIAKFYTQAFFKDLKKLNIIPPTIVAKATDNIQEDIKIIQELEKKGYTYITSDGIYFDTSKLKDYGKLTGKAFAELQKSLKAGARIEFSPEKKNVTDFALWKFSPKNVRRQMEWDSPWGKGFPGWHIECTAINLKYLANAFRGRKFIPQKAQTIDIHCGGIDHIPIHHTNEIAQAEAATGKKFVNYWLHGEFLNLAQKRMGKSEGNMILLKDVENQGYSPLAFRYLILNSHYRTPVIFSWDALSASQEALHHLYEFTYDCLWFSQKIKNKNTQKNKNNKIKKDSLLLDLESFKQKWLQALEDDLNTPQSLAVGFQLMSSYYQAKKTIDYHPKFPQKIFQLLLDFDSVWGLGLNKITLPSIPSKIQKLYSQRETLRTQKNFSAADQIRKELESKNWFVEDTPWGSKLIPQNYLKSYFININ